MIDSGAKGGPLCPQNLLLILNLFISILSLSIHLLSKLMCMYCSCQVIRRGTTVNLYVFLRLPFCNIVADQWSHDEVRQS